MPLSKEKTDPATPPYNLCLHEVNYVPITATIGLLDKAEGQESKLAHDSQPSCCDSVRFGRKIRPRRSRNATQMPPPRFESAFSLILGLDVTRTRRSVIAHSQQQAH
jgi:hypothetical protein